jgi:hypothetical protein
MLCCCYFLPAGGRGFDSLWAPLSFPVDPSSRTEALPGIFVEVKDGRPVFKDKSLTAICEPIV